MNETCHRRTGFCNQCVEVRGHGRAAVELIDLLCRDLIQKDSHPAPRAVYELMAAGRQNYFSLWQGQDRLLYFGRSPYAAAYNLINEILYQTITDNDHGHAIHAAAVAGDQGTILLPGTSGSGKSTLTAWLLANGYGYLSDELVVIDTEQGKIFPFVRPLSLKKTSREILASFLDLEQSMLIDGEEGFMLPHRRINPQACDPIPALSLIVLPRYNRACATTLTRLTPAAACAMLLESFVNARNFEGHGITGLAGLCRRIPVYQLTYSSFEGVLPLLTKALAESSARQ